LKTSLIKFLKLSIPILFGIGLIWLFYDALCENQKADLFKSFSEANYFWVTLSLVFAWLSLLSRAYRQKYLLKPMGYKVSFWNAYHALMIGYLVNLAFPRAGEASRAAILFKTEKIPFEKGLGTIIAERAFDVLMLGIVSLIAISLQFDKLNLFRSAKEDFVNGEGSCANTMVFSVLGNIVLGIIILAVIVGVILFITKKELRHKIIDLIKGVFEGVFAIFKSKDKLPFLGHTLFIWTMYIIMFSICFLALDSTSVLGIEAMLAGFVAGTVGMILVQGGIGVYPAFVGVIVTIYMTDSGGGAISPEALALGWIIWTSQTLMMIILGLVSMIINNRNTKQIND